MSDDEKYMKRALELAAKGLGDVSPNPMVGAVIVCDGRVIGEGYHMKYGSWHAEVNAVNSVAKADLSLLPESTIYVTLEPCAHFGKTPPCALLLKQKNFKRVVVACRDPFPMVDGKGIEILSEAGIEVSIGVLEPEARELNRRFFTLHEKHRPYITLKWAQTADHFIGRIGERVYISNEKTTLISQQLRASEMAIMVGWNTVLNDDPRLTVRQVDGHNPLRVTLYHGSAAEVKRELLGRKIVNDESETVVFVNKVDSDTEQVYKINTFARCIPINMNADVWQQVLHELYLLNVSSLIVEGGCRLLQNVINTGVWDEARVETNTAFRLLDGVCAPVLPPGLKLKKTLKVDEHIIEVLTR